MSKRSKKNPTITGVRASDFENFITAGSNLAGDQNADLSINRRTVKSKKFEWVRKTKEELADIERMKSIKGPGGNAARLGKVSTNKLQKISKEDRFERANLLDISQDDLNNLSANFLKRQAQVIGRRQQPGRNQLILTRETV